MVPSAHGAWLAANIPRARARLLPGQGHLTLIASEFGRILDDLLDLAGKSGTSRSVTADNPERHDA